MLLASVLIGRASAAETVENAELRMALTMPDGFSPDAQVTAAQRDFVHAFRRANSASGVDDLIIVERMRGTIGRERLDRQQLPRDFTGRLSTAQWQGFELDVIELPETLEGRQIINYNVQVPLKPEAIQLRVIGPRGEATRLRELLDNLLSGLKGESNWATVPSPAQSPGPVSPAWGGAPRNYGVIILVSCILAVVTGVAVLWLISRRTPRGTVLILAIVIYATSWAIGSGNTREMRATVGVVRMIGFIGLVLGLIDTFRRRPDHTRANVPHDAGVNH
jgi:hypothetical protein